MAGVQAARRGAVRGMLVADALAMPVHWYYKTDAIRTEYDGWITGYKSANEKHPFTFLSLSPNTDGNGQDSDGAVKKPVIGNIILHDKLKYWANDGRGPQMQPGKHVHHGLAAGDNTLNALTSLHILQTMQEADPSCEMDPRELRARVIQAYVTFMTSEGTHNDVYAESFHRLFVRDWSQLENPPRDGEGILKFTEERFTRLGKGEELGALTSIGAIDMAIPWIIHYADKSVEECSENVMEAIKMTHPAPSLLPYVSLYSHLLHAVLHGADLRGEIQKEAKSSVFESGADELQKYLDEASQSTGASDDLETCQDATKTLGLACAIGGAMKSCLYLATKFDQNFENGVLTNANCGGENVHRGGALGALLGAFTISSGKTIPEHLIKGLHSGSELASQIVAKL